MTLSGIRIDERLIHGQVATLWQGMWQCNRIMVIDKASAEDPLLKSVLKISCPPGVALSVITSETAAKNLLNNKYGQERITIVTKTPQNLVDLMNYGFSIPIAVTVGNMSNGKDKIRISKHIAVTQNDIDNFRTLSAANVKIVAQTVPSESAVEFMSLLESVISRNAQ